MPSMTLTCRFCELPMQKSSTSKPQGEAAHNKCRTSQPKPTKPAVFYPPCRICAEPMLAAVKRDDPIHKACKTASPQWMIDGRQDPAILKAEKAKAKAESKARHADMRSDIRAGYEDGDLARFTRGLKDRTTLTPEGCWQWSGALRDGYAYARFATGRQVMIHRLSLEMKHGAPLGVLAAHHKCANTSCVNPDHLQPVTHRENVAEMLARNSLEARIAELELALTALAPNHEALNRVRHVAA